VKNENRCLCRNGEGTAKGNQTPSCNTFGNKVNGFRHDQSFTDFGMPTISEEYAPFLEPELAVESSFEPFFEQVKSIQRVACVLNILSVDASRPWRIRRNRRTRQM
jgi:hypothetical protein